MVTYGAKSPPSPDLARINVQGHEEHRCTKCNRWKDPAAFPRRPIALRGTDSWCSACKNRDKRIKRELVSMQQRSRSRAQAAADKRMDKVNLGKQRQIRLDAVPVRKWLAIVSNGDNRSTISLRLGISERSLYRIEVQSTKVDVSLAEIIAEAANCRDEFYALLGEPGVIGWSKAGHRYCVECGTWWRKHRAKGMCARCYIRTWQAKKFSYRTKSPDMWSHDYAKCRRCSTTKHKHRARGFCGPCYDSIRLTARSLRVPLPGYIDSYDIMIT